MSFYVELVLCTAGSVLYLFLLTLFAGLRRRREFETTLFLMGMAVFFFYVGRLLWLNARIQYATPPQFTYWCAGGLMLLALYMIPPLSVHTHVAYLRQFEEGRSRAWTTILVVAFYLGSLLGTGFATLYIMDYSPELLYGGIGGVEIFTSLAFLVSAGFEGGFAKRASSEVFRRLHVALGLAFFALALIWLVPLAPYLRQIGLLIPGLFFGYFVLRKQSLYIGFQRNLVFSVTAAFLALLYLTLVRRVSDWLEPYFPPVATTSVFLFTLVVFFDPLQRSVGKALQRTFRAEAEQLQRLTAEIQQVARAGNLAELISFSETRIRDSFALSAVRIYLRDSPVRPADDAGKVQWFTLRNGPVEIGTLETYFFGQSLSGETHAALDYLAEQLPAAIDLCRLLDEKLRLERELAERERLALLGQMAASISHNLRNPLSSMKTLLQLQLENPELPASARPDCEKAIAEVDRLNAKLTQLLHYAKPQVRSGITAATADAAAVAARTVALLQHEAERRGVSLTLDGASQDAKVAATEEALSEVLSNLIVNAMEAVQSGGSVRVTLARRDTNITLEILDDGPGIPEYVRPRIFQPFFTTKPSGTGLGLAIVEKRLAEIGGSIACESPVQNMRGTRFVVMLRAAPD